MATNHFFIILCFGLITISTSSSNSDSNQSSSPNSNSDLNHGDDKVQLPNDKLSVIEISDLNAKIQKAGHVNLPKSLPFNNIFMGIYKNYRSTYLGNRTSSQYKKSLQEINPIQESITSNSESKDELTAENPTAQTSIKPKKKKKKTIKLKKGSQKKNESTALLYSYDGEYRYNLGPGVNLTLDMNQDIVNVNLDEDCLKDIFYGKWTVDSTGRGRGKKHEMISKILPLFILPFLIQSAIIPFLVAKLKLLLVKSILIGKLAIFLLIISAIKNNQKTPTYEAAPAYWASEPSRRSEMFNGYRVEGRPTNWVN